MSILVTGSIAIDHIMVFEDHFRNHILPDKVHILNVAFLVPGMEKRYGGTGANIAYNLRALGDDPALLATVGSDLGVYRAWMDRHGIRRDYVVELEDAYTAQCFITTDLDNNQITSFHPGAMDRAHEAKIDDVKDDLAVGIVAPNGKQAMQDYAAQLKARGVKTVVDPGQGLPMFSGDELVELLEGAAVYVVNDYEWSMTLEKTGLDEDAIAEKVGALIVTRGAEGSRVRRGGRDLGVELGGDVVDVRSVEPDAVVDPTGCGDAYRSGILHALAKGLPLEKGAQLGSLMGSLKVARSGPQSIEIGPAVIAAQYEKAFGETIETIAG